MADLPQSTATVERLERDVEERSAVFKKELGLFDLVLTQVVFVVGTIWVGHAAKLGNEQNVFWILAIITFYLPLAGAVIFLNRLMPLEGGLYQWAKFAFNDFVAFMVAWNLWVFAISILAGIGLVVTTNISYAIGSDAAWMRETQKLIFAVSFVLVVAMILAAVRGLSLGKWVHNAGGLMLMITFTALILMPFIALMQGSITEYHPFAMQVPTLSAYNINVFSKLALGALTGFEYIAILAGETKAPANNIGRSVLISAPIIAVMFILGTSSVLAFVSPANVDLISPIPQVLTAGFGSSGWVGKLVTFTILGVVMRQIALMSIYFAGNTRLPMVAGWDSLLPHWFTRLHPTYKTPVNSILFVGAVTLVMGLLSLLGVGAQEAFQLLDNAGGVFYAITYLVLFAVPLFGMKAFGVRTPMWLKIACASGFIVTVIYIGFTVVPIIEVGSRITFAAKIISTVLLANIVGIGLYKLGKQRSSTSS
ncbi:MAG TPA: APC family permease [Pyrinomonadaceae bacterium]|jgi:amino acid transporter|nr:APC family permease [Pyrinomonadaceae bacterium]